MISQPEGAQTYWFVGATFDKTEDQTQRFIQGGIWELKDPPEKYMNIVRSMQPGDSIAMKSTYVRKYGLPFDNRGNGVSVMAIKAIGTIKSNLGDGLHLQVDWKAVDPPREWFFNTYRSVIWKVMPGDWKSDALVRFTFEAQDQDINQFCNDPTWRDRFGDSNIERWTRFYEEVADKLLPFRNRRDELIPGIHTIASKLGFASSLQDKYTDGTSGPLKDICPFTVIGIFNRGITDANRKIIAGELANLLGVFEPVPDSFEGIPVLFNQNLWFFGHEIKRKPDDIEKLWEVFTQAIAFAESDDKNTRSAFISAFDQAMLCYNVKWTLTMGLYWIRPSNFLSLDGVSRPYICDDLKIKIENNGPRGCCNANDYLELMDTLEDHFQKETYPVHSFPDLSLAAWISKDKGKSNSPGSTKIDEPEGGTGETPQGKIMLLPIEPYTIENIRSDGCFITQDKLKMILERLRTKKNVILQGPPGTGKTWLAKRLAFALIGQQNDDNVRVVQFHPNLSYEDFIRGFRPEGDGKLKLVDGPFVKMIEAAKEDSSSNYVIVIEEINRGNPAQIFGEMLTLLEADKRTPNSALELSYKKMEKERVYIPGNLYIIGTMNIADRSLALVDLALRRRFAFIDLEPILGDTWRNWVQEQFGIDSQILFEIEKRIKTLNNTISNDVSLGPQFRIGHSYVTPSNGYEIGEPKEWFRQVVETEIGPLLDEYWFDSPKNEKSKDERELLLKDF